MSQSRAVGFVLAGGQSSRMGTDKALVQFAGEPLIRRALRILEDAGLSAAIAGARIGLEAYATVVPDEEPARGPLAGICSALRSIQAASAHAESAVFLSVDTPLLPPALIRYLVWHNRMTESLITLPSVNGFAQTFPCVVRRHLLPALEDALASGHAGCFAAFRSAARAMGQPMTVLPVELLVQAGQLQHPQQLPAALWFMNLNTAEDLRHAARCISRGAGVI